MPQIDWLISESGPFEVWATCEFDVEPASGDGWNEPRLDARAFITSVKLFSIRQQARRDETGAYKRVAVRELLAGAAPQWVWELLNEDENLQLEMLEGNDAPDADAWRDNLIDRELVESRS